MTILVLFGGLAVLLLLSVPIGIALGAATLISILYGGDLPLDFLTQSLITSIDSFPLLAIPLFILAGEIMGRGGVSNRLFQFANSIVGDKTGGFAVAAIITCMFFAAISGSGPATVAAIGGIMIPAMIREGYDKKFATAVVCAAGSLGVIIPPSIPMIIFGVVGETSVGDMFIAGILPGILVAIGLMLWAYLYSSKMGYKGTEKTSFTKFLNTGWEAKWALLIPVIILGGIYGGIFTPTEAAVVAVVYGVIAGAFLYKELSFKELPNIIVDASLTTATILIILGMATGFGRLLTIEEIPGKIAAAITSISENTTVILLLILLVLIIVGCFMETTAAIIILVPILMPIALNTGMNPTHFGIVVVVGLAIGFITPPLGVNLFVGSGISGLRIETLSKAIVPFFIMMLIALIIITFIPQISLFLMKIIE